MAEPTHTSIDRLTGLYLIECLKRISNQLTDIRRGQEREQARSEQHRATQDFQTVLLGQILEAMRAIEPPAKTFGLPIWLANLHDWSKRIELLQKLYRAIVWARVVLWPAYIVGGLRYLGWL